MEGGGGGGRAGLMTTLATNEREREREREMKNPKIFPKNSHKTRKEGRKVTKDGGGQEVWGSI